MFKRIDHIELVTARPERAVAFYTDVLGFRVRSEQRIPKSPLGPLELVYLELGGTTVELMRYPEGRRARLPEGQGDRVHLGTDEAARLRARRDQGPRWQLDRAAPVA